ncbi:hypothetical protein [Aeromicrobium sp. 9AM]|uniref:hypothetical protein n=1 Tax=Aeromicrobium sp. 9AM TaxID=2653126 RepID=UPI00135C26F9|nr:hypothetical protein [Aeromicrobium sp. 9AM]
MAISLCLVANYVAALAVLTSPWGSVFMLDDDFHNSSIAVSVAVGLVLGLAESVIFTPQIAIAAAGIGLIGLATIFLAFTLATQVAGIGLGCVLGWLLRQHATHLRHEVRKSI